MSLKTAIVSRLAEWKLGEQRLRRTREKAERRRREEGRPHVVEYFHQPDDPLFSGNPVGDEIADPNYFTGGMCPAGRRCRFSDSAFVDYSVERGRNIARTEGWNNGSLTISSSGPRLT